MKQEQGQSPAPEKKKGIIAKGKEFVEKHPWWTVAAIGFLAIVL